MRLTVVVFISSVLSLIAVASSAPVSACSSRERSLWSWVDEAPRIVVGNIRGGTLHVTETLKGSATSTISLRTPAHMTKCNRRFRSDTRVLLMLTLDGALIDDSISVPHVYRENPAEGWLQSIRTYLSTVPTKQCLPQKLRTLR